MGAKSKREMAVIERVTEHAQRRWLACSMIIELATPLAAAFWHTQVGQAPCARVVINEHRGSRAREWVFALDPKDQIPDRGEELTEVEARGGEVACALSGWVLAPLREAMALDATAALRHMERQVGLGVGSQRSDRPWNAQYLPHLERLVACAREIPEVWALAMSPAQRRAWGEGGERAAALCALLDAAELREELASTPLPVSKPRML